MSNFMFFEDTPQKKPNGPAKENLLEIRDCLKTYHSRHIWGKGYQFDIASAFGNIIAQLNCFNAQLESLNDNAISQNYLASYVETVIDSLVSFNQHSENMHGEIIRDQKITVFDKIIISKKDAASFSALERVNIILRKLRANNIESEKTKV